MSGFVVKLAQPGFDVETAGDENLIYNSNWPLLKIAFEGSYASDNVSKSAEVVKHNLGFPPMFWYFANTPIGAWQNVGNVGVARRAEFMGPVGDGKVAVDDTRLSWAPSTPFSGTSGKTKFYYYVFALDLTKQYNAPIIKVGALIGGRPKGTVFKIAKPTKSVGSKDLSDFMVHSQCRSPLVHSVNPSPGVVKNFVATHGLGYLPIFFAYIKDAKGRYIQLYTGQGGSSNLNSGINDITFNDSGGQEITIVILKDPFLVDASRRVVV